MYTLSDWMHIFFGTSDKTRRTTWGVLSCVLWICIFSLSNFTHFTWWSIASFSVYSLLGALDVEYYFYWFFLSIQINVISGVLVMSIKTCDMLNDAKDDVGAIGYIIGNLFIHYIPFLVAVYFRQPTKLSIERPHTGKGGIVSGYALFIIYNGLNDAIDVYGCDFNKQWVILGALSLTAVLYIEEYYKIIGIGHHP